MGLRAHLILYIVMEIGSPPRPKRAEIPVRLEMRMPWSLRCEPQGAKEDNLRGNIACASGNFAMMRKRRGGHGEEGVNKEERIFKGERACHVLSLAKKMTRNKNYQSVSHGSK